MNAAIQLMQLWYIQPSQPQKGFRYPYQTPKKKKRLPLSFLQLLYALILLDD